MDDVTNILFCLLRSALGCGRVDGKVLCDAGVEQWRRVMGFSWSQGVAAIAVDGLERIMDANPAMELMLNAPELEDLKYEWLCSVFQAENEHAGYLAKVNELCSIFSDAGLRPVILKGLGAGVNYPVPEHRTVGDIDIFIVGGSSLDGDLLIKKKLGLKVTKSKIGHHSHFIFKGVSVENHYELSNTYFSDSRMVLLEKNLQKIIARDLWKPFEQSVYWLPCADFNALFLMWHMSTHFCIEKINLRQLCDWLMFLKQHGSEIDWPEIHRIWRKTGLDGFADATGSVMVKYFGMPFEWMPGLKYDNALADRVMNDIVGGEKRKGSGIVNIGRYARHGWKYRLATGRSWVVPMLKSAWMHLLHGEDLVEKKI